MKRLGCVFLLIAACQTLAAANGLYLNSLGSRASAMGGAFVGLADDFSAVYWNPAGIASFDRRIFGFSGSDSIPRLAYRRDYHVPGLGNVTLIDAETIKRHLLSGLAAYYHPLGEQWTAGIGVYSPCRFQTSWRGADFAPMANDNPSINWMSKIGIVTISPTLAYKMSRTVSIGVAINIHHGLFELQRHAGTFNFPLPEPPYFYPIELGQYKESLSGWGYGATIGILFKPNEMISTGVTLRTPSRITYQGEARIPGFSELGIAFSRDLKQVAGAEKRITWPLWLALGGAFRPHHALVLTADLQWTRWTTWDTIKTEYPDPLWNSYMSERGNDILELSWKNTVQARFGAEYHLTEAVAFRGGFYTSPSPSPKNAMNVLLPAFSFTAMTFGMGYRLKDIQMDFGLEYLTSRTKNDDFGLIPRYPPPSGSIWETANPGLYKMKTIVLSLSFGYRL